jgi:hypothetical protein
MENTDKTLMQLEQIDEFINSDLNNKLKLDIHFQRDVFDIDFKNHRTDEIKNLNPSDYEIVDLNLDKVFHAVFSKIEPYYGFTSLRYSYGQIN